MGCGGADLHEELGTYLADFLIVVENVVVDVVVIVPFVEAVYKVVCDCFAEYNNEGECARDSKVKDDAPSAEEPVCVK